MLTYWNTAGGIDAARVLGGLLDAGADTAVVAAILAKLTLPRAVLFASRTPAATGMAGMAGTAVGVAVSPVGQERRLIEVIHAVEDGALPLAVRTWGGGVLRRLAEAEALVRAVPVDAVPLDDPRGVAELVAVVAALAALRVVRVFAAPLPPRSQDAAALPSHAALVIAALLDEAGWPEADDAGADIQAVFITPGGAALLAALAEPGLPTLRLHAVGYGLAAEAAEAGEIDAPPLAVWVGEPHGAALSPTDNGAMPAHTHPHPHAPGDEQ